MSPPLSLGLDVFCRADLQQLYKNAVAYNTPGNGQSGDPCAYHLLPWPVQPCHTQLTACQHAEQSQRQRFCLACTFGIRLIHACV